MSVTTFIPHSLTIISLLICTFLVSVSNGANILFMHTYASYSHRHSMMPLANAMAELGHKVSYFSCVDGGNPHPDIYDVIPHDLERFINDSINMDLFNIDNRIAQNLPELHEIFLTASAAGCKLLVADPLFQNWLVDTKKLDLIISDLVFDCALGIAEKYDAKIILFNSVAFYALLPEALGLPIESDVSYVENVIDFSSFYGRIKHAILPLQWKNSEQREWETLKLIFRQHLRLNEIPTLSKLKERIVMVFQSGNYISEAPRSLPPMFVSIPGLHIKGRKELKTLPKEIEKFINLSIDGIPSKGFIYMSLGTVVKPKNIPEKLVLAFLNSMAKYPEIRFLWRWEGTFNMKPPKNVFIDTWFPQQELLAHNKIRGFITQCGRPSIQEALTHGVPTINFPVLGDQDFNSWRTKTLGMSITLEISTVTEDEFTDAINSILNDDLYSQKAKDISKIYNDPIFPPLEVAKRSVEFVLRHSIEQLSLMKSISRHESWYRRRNLDVWLFLYSMVLIVVCLIFLILKRLVKVLLHKESVKAKIN